MVGLIEAVKPLNLALLILLGVIKEGFCECNCIVYDQGVCKERDKGPKLGLIRVTTFVVNADWMTKDILIF